MIKARHHDPWEPTILGYMQFGVLGPTRVWRDDGTQLTSGGPRRRALLARLILDAGTTVPTRQLLEDLYGSHPPDNAANALQSQVSRLRRMLGPDNGSPGTVEYHSDGYRLTIDSARVDAHLFERNAAEGRRAEASGRHRDAAAKLGQALALWRGQALADLSDFPFTRAPAQRLGELRLRVLEDRATALVQLGQGEELTEELLAELAAHPLRERLRAQVMRALAQGGRQAKALRVFEDGRALLAEELGANPTPELAEAHLAILRGEEMRGEDMSPQTATLTPAAPHGLPAQRTRFVPGTSEPAQLAQICTDTRLLTLTGPGGVGKTRLATETAAQTPQPVCFVELAPLMDATEVPHALLNALGLRETSLISTSGQQLSDPMTRLVTALGTNPPLVVLDNCEHLVTGTAATVDRLLSACPELRIIATSREPLGVAGETVRPVRPLALPMTEATAQQALQAPAVRMFVDRATAATPEFQLDAATVAAVVQICRTLDGLPLAIELAAARLRTLAVSEVATRLQDRFSLLSRGNRTADPRHQTLHAVVAWSWELLSEHEQEVLSRLAVPAGGVSVPSTAALGELTEADALEVLTSLTEKSLLESVDGGRRYRMLETIRAFGLARLAETDQEHTIRQRHAAHFLHEVAEPAGQALLGPRQLHWLRLLDAERDNLHAAVRWHIDTDPLTALRMVAALTVYWWLRGQRDEATQLSAALMPHLDSRPPAELAEEHVLCVLNASADGVTLANPEPYLDEAAATITHLTAPVRCPILIILWPMYAGATDLSLRGINQFLDMAATTPDPWVQAATDVVRGYVGLYTGETTDPTLPLETALTQFRALGERWGIIQALSALATPASWGGQLARSRELVIEALALATDLNATEEQADLYLTLAEAHLRSGDTAGARTEFAHAAQLAIESGTTETLAMARCGHGVAARTDGELDLAHQWCSAAVQLIPDGWAGGVPVLGSRMTLELGLVEAARGDTAAARCLRERAATASRHSWIQPNVTLLVHLDAEIATLDNDGHQAALLLGILATASAEWPVAAYDTTHLATRARELLGDETYAAAFTAGTAMSPTEAAHELGAAPSLFP